MKLRSMLVLLRSSKAKRKLPGLLDPLPYPSNIMESKDLDEFPLTLLAGSS